jgi:hypothetical protein
LEQAQTGHENIVERMLCKIRAFAEKGGFILTLALIDDIAEVDLLDIRA